MLPNDTINLDKPATLTLAPQTIAIILDALANLPYRNSNGPISEIVTQLRGGAANTVRDEIGVSGKGNGQTDDPYGSHPKQTRED